MDFSAQLDTLQQHVTAAKEATQAAAAESRDKLQQRIGQAQVQMDLAVKDAQQQASDASAAAQHKWAQLKADSAARMDNVKARIDKRSAQLDAKVAAADANDAESEAGAAVDFAAWAVDNARLALLAAIDARAYADERAQTVRSS